MGFWGSLRPFQMVRGGHCEALSTHVRFGRKPERPGDQSDVAPLYKRF